MQWLKMKCLKTMPNSQVLQKRKIQKVIQSYNMYKPNMGVLPTDSQVTCFVFVLDAGGEN